MSSARKTLVSEENGASVRMQVQDGRTIFSGRILPIISDPYFISSAPSSHILHITPHCSPHNYEPSTPPLHTPPHHLYTLVTPSLHTHSHHLTHPFTSPVQYTPSPNLTHLSHRLFTHLHQLPPTPLIPVSTQPQNHSLHVYTTICPFPFIPLYNIYWHEKYSAT